MGVRTTVNKERGCYGVTELQSDLRFMTAEFWSSKGLRCENMPLLLATGEWLSTVYRHSPDHPLSQNKRKHVTAPAPARHAYLLINGKKGPTDSVHNATFSIRQPSRVNIEKSF